MVTYNLEGLSKEYFAGFWQRTAAYVIDFAIVWIAVTSVALAINIAKPGTIHIAEPPFVPYSEQTIRNDTTSEQRDGKYFVVVSEIKKRTTFSMLTNHYLLETTYEVDENGKRVDNLSYWVLLPYDIETGETLENWGLSTGVFELVFLIIYVGVMDSSIFSSTLGKKIMGIIVLHENGHQLKLGKANLRSFLRLFSIAILFIGVLMIPFDNQRRSLHDRLLQTRVVKKSRFKAV